MAAGSPPSSLIVVCTGRCGSTLLSNMVRLHPEVLSLSELFVLLGPRAFEPGLVTGERFWEILSVPDQYHTMMLRGGLGFKEWLYQPAPGRRYTAETGVPPIVFVTLPHLTDEPEALFDELAEWVPSLEPRPIGEQFARLFGWLCRRFGRTVWMERSGTSLGWVSSVAALFPEARIVHLHRDGRECAVSMSLHNGFKLLALVRGGWVPDGVAWPPSAERPFDIGAFDRARPPAWMLGGAWSDMVVEGSRQLMELEPGRVSTMRYEALVADPADELRRLVRLCGWAEDEEWVSRASALVVPQEPRWVRLPEAERTALVEACAPGMALLERRDAH